MTIAIIGAGNMGAAIAKGLAQAGTYNVRVSNPHPAKLQALQQSCPSIHVTTDNVDCVNGADVVILAVKPWKMAEVIGEIAHALTPATQALVSIAGGVSLDDFDSLLGDMAVGGVYHIIPDTAIAVGTGMTFISARRSDEASTTAVRDMFATMGAAAVIEERLMPAATALSSCGIAYAYKYVQACVQAGVQMGFYPHQALEYTIATVEGAMAMLKANGTTPQTEIDRVTTPGGMTIRGINQLERSGFTAAVIDAVLKPLQP